MPAALAKAVSALPTKTYGGVVYRRIPAGRDAAASAHSHSAGGRWNPPGEFGALYTATDEAGIEGGMERAAAKRGITARDLLPRDIVTLSVSLQRVLDLTDPANLRALGTSAHDLIDDRYERTWDLARAAFGAGSEKKRRAVAL